jgi:hypothetical protein
MSTSRAESLANPVTGGAAGAAPGTGVPHAPQKANPGWMRAPQLEQFAASAAAA